MLDTAFIRSIREGLKQTRKPKERGTDELTQEYKEMTPGQTDEALDPVNKDAVKKKFKNRKDKDIDNDGDVDSSDKYLAKRRKAISKAIKKDEGAMKRGKDLDTFKPKPKKEEGEMGNMKSDKKLETDPYAGTDIDASQLGQLQEQQLMAASKPQENPPATRNKPSMETGPDKRFSGLPAEAGNQNVDSRTERRVG